MFYTLLLAEGASVDFIKAFALCEKYESLEEMSIKTKVLKMFENVKFDYKSGKIPLIAMNVAQDALNSPWGNPATKVIVASFLEACKYFKNINHDINYKELARLKWKAEKGEITEEERKEVNRLFKATKGVTRNIKRFSQQHPTLYQAKKIGQEIAQQFADDLLENVA